MPEAAWRQRHARVGPLRACKRVAPAPAALPAGRQPRRASLPRSDPSGPQHEPGAIHQAHATPTSVTRHWPLFHTCDRTAACAGPGARREVVGDGVADEHAPLDEGGHLRLHLRAGAAAASAAARAPRPQDCTAGAATGRRHCGVRHGAVSHSAHRAHFQQEKPHCERTAREAGASSIYASGRRRGCACAGECAAPRTAAARQPGHAGGCRRSACGSP